MITFLSLSLSLSLLSVWRSGARNNFALIHSVKCKTNTWLAWYREIFDRFWIDTNRRKHPAHPLFISWLSCARTIFNARCLLDMSSSSCRWRPRHGIDFRRAGRVNEILDTQEKDRSTKRWCGSNCSSSDVSSTATKATWCFHPGGRFLNWKNGSRIFPSSRVYSKSTRMPIILWISCEKQRRFSFKRVRRDVLIEREDKGICSLEAASFVFAVSLALPVIMIGVGKKTSFTACSEWLFIELRSLGISNLEECPLNRNIPVFVLVGGAIAALKLLQVLWKQYNRRRGPAEEETTDTRNGSVRCLAKNSSDRFLLGFLPDENTLSLFIHSFTASLNNRRRDKESLIPEEWSIDALLINNVQGIDRMKGA